MTQSCCAIAKILSTVFLLLSSSFACEDQYNDSSEGRQNIESILLNDIYKINNPWLSRYYYGYYRQPSAQISSGYGGLYEGRAPASSSYSEDNSFGYFDGYNYNTASNDKNSGEPENRMALRNFGSSLINTGIFNNRFTPANTFRPFAGFGSRLPFIPNPNFVQPFASYGSCTSPSGESGICSSGTTCSLFGGRPSGSCTLGRVCCINAVTTCGGSVTLNNTYWQSPTTAISTPSTCALTVVLDQKLAEQPLPICQVRLDLISFATYQPADNTGVCNTDTFQVAGATNKVPTICGDNNNQHMYLEVPSSDTKATNLQLLFNFGALSFTRSWNIKIAMIPCGASYRAPSDCLQYFTGTTGKVRSFNWRDVTVTASATRKLANQDYNICFRTEAFDNQRASSMCLSTCTATASPYKISISPLYVNANCPNNFLVFVGGSSGTDFADRYCGAAFNPSAATPAPSGSATSVCSSMKPFRMSYKTNDVSEVCTGGLCPVGFCLDYTMKP